MTKRRAPKQVGEAGQRLRSGKACGMTRYPDAERAKAALRTIKTRGEVRAKTPTRWFTCPRCKGCHLATDDVQEDE